jgi:4'-phosphopantetheinyl transferase
MIKLAYCNVESLDLRKAYPLVSRERKEKIDFYRFDKDKKLSCGAYLLLKRLLGEVDIAYFDLKYSKYGKAYISTSQNIYFNLSHSGKMVACAISDREVGVDVELIDPTIDLNIAKNYFFNSEYEGIMKSQNQPDEFFRYWVLKESYMKYTGLGFNLDLDSFEIILGDEIKLKNDEDNIKFSLFDVGEYKLACASNYSIQNCFEYKIDDLY